MRPAPGPFAPLPPCALRFALLVSALLSLPGRAEDPPPDDAERAPSCLELETAQPGVCRPPPVVLDERPVDEVPPPPATDPPPVVVDERPADEAPPPPAADLPPPAQPAPVPAATPQEDESVVVEEPARPPSVGDARLDPRATPPPPAPSPAPPAPAPSDDEGLRFGFGGVPALNYDADNGFGFGAVGSVFVYDGERKPYRYAVTLQLFMTSKLIQDHQLRFDAIDLFDLPLRVTFRGGYFQSLTQPFCGFGNAVACDPKLAERDADRLGLEGDARAAFERRYYLTRFIQPNANLLLRWRFNDLPDRFEVMAGWRGHGYIPGEWADEDADGAPDLAPYPGSYYAQAFPKGEPGFASVLQVGVMLDNRDNEPAPKQGYWLEASLRGSSLLWGSSWQYVGANATLRGYVPLLPDKSLVLADRLVLDATFGDLPLQEMVRVGGSLDYMAFGGNPMGRGIRVQRYVGRLKVLNQTELRWDVIEHELFGQRFLWTLGALLDAGWIGYDWTDLRGDPLGLRFGYGGTLRLAWNRDFVVRVDLATSADEGYGIAPYIDISHPF